MRERERERERERASTASVFLRCYYFASRFSVQQLDKHYINNDAQTAGSYILKFKEALLEVADIKRRDIESFMLNSCTIAELKTLIGFVF